MSNTRRSALIGMIGANGTGKSTVTKEIANYWKASRPPMRVQNGIIYNARVVFDIFGQMIDITDFGIRRDTGWAKTIDSKVKSSLVILDDYKLLVEGYVPTDGMIDLFINRRHSDLDYIYSCHSPSSVIPQIIPYTTHFYIFYTKTIQGVFKERMPFSDLLITACSLVNKYVSIHGMGMHPSDPQFNGPVNKGQKFPYCIVDTDKSKVTAVNMNKPLVINPTK